MQNFIAWHSGGNERQEAKILFQVSRKKSDQFNENLSWETIFLTSAQSYSIIYLTSHFGHTCTVLPRLNLAKRNMYIYMCTHVL